MSKAIAYSLFGYDRTRAENCFDFNSYLRGFMLCIRFNRLIYPDFDVILQTDHATYTGFEPLFKSLQDKNIVRIEKNKNGAALCEAMLWRLKPVFWKDNFHKWEFSHVLCRDVDSPSTYREAQAVQMWMNHDKAIHAICDSVSHGVPMLGGMIGIRPDYFSARTSCNSFTELMSLCKIDLSAKGTDQDFLNQQIYHRFAEKGTESITQHYFKGMGKSWLNDFHTCSCWMEACAVGHHDACPENITLAIPEELRESDKCCQHIGSSGWNEPSTMAFIYKHRHKFEDILSIEKLYTEIFHWAK